MWITVETTEDERLEASDAIPATRRSVLDSVAGEVLDTNPLPLFARQVYRASLSGRSPELSAEEATQLYGLDGALTFEGPVSRFRAEELYAIKRRELLRQDYLARGPRGLLGELGVGFGAALMDPTSALAFLVPGGAPLRAGSSASTFGFNAVASRTLQGSAIGLAEAAALEAAVFPLAAIQEQRDYTFADSLLNLLVGGGLGAIGGGLQGYLDVRRARDAQLQGAPTQDIANLGGQQKQAVFASAIDQASRGRPVDIEPLVETLKAQAKAETTDLNGFEAALYRPVDVIAGGGSEARARYAVVDIRALVTSNDDDLRVNPAFPQDLQPRDRTRTDSQLQVNELAANLDPRRLAETFDAGTGAPIVGRDGVVESGNGRTLALRKAYRQNPERAQAYRSFLAGRGYKVDGIEQPVLVRLRDDLPDMAERAAFARDANRRQVAAFSPSEQALSDAAQLTPDLIDLYQGGGADLAGNRNFARRFIDRVVGAEDRGAVIDADGNLSPDGMRRVNQALVAYAYDDLALVTRMAETGNPGMRTIGNALQTAAPDMARIRAMIERGDLPGDASPVPSMIEALGLIQEARRMGSLREALSQQDAFSVSGWSAEAEFFARVFYKDDALKRPRSQVKIATTLQKLATSLEDEANAVLLGGFDAQRPTLDRIAATLERRADEWGAGDGDALRALAVEIRDGLNAGRFDGRGNQGRAEAPDGPANPPAQGDIDPAASAVSDFLDNQQRLEADQREGLPLAAPDRFVSDEALPATQELAALEEDIKALAELSGEANDPPQIDADTTAELFRAGAFCIKHHGDKA
ncbi:MAG: hypothetical protein AAGF20_00335 [Pseudomonadota bacterium]